VLGKRVVVGLACFTPRATVGANVMREAEDYKADGKVDL
jgi:hypothetical protein